MEKQRNMKQHVSFVGALHVGFGILGLVGALAIYFGFHFVFNFIEDEPIAQNILSYVVNTRNSSFLVERYFSTSSI